MHQIIIGVDTHKSNHIAVAINTQGARLDGMTVPTTRQGYRDLETWAATFGQVKAFGIEGTGSDGAGLSRYLLAKGHTILDVMRPNRQLRYLHGKSDSLDAEGAARSVLNGQAKALAKSQTGSSEMIRHIKIARDSAVKSNCASNDHVESIDYQCTCRATRYTRSDQRVRDPGPSPRSAQTKRDNSPMMSAKAAMRAIARRWPTLHEEIQIHEQELEHQFAPTIQQIGSDAIAAGNGRNALAVIMCLYHDPQLFRRRLATTATAISDDFYLRHKHVLKAILKPPWSGQGVRSKWGPVQYASFSVVNPRRISFTPAARQTRELTGTGMMLRDLGSGTPAPRGHKHH